jgi:hypothetical protein
MLIKYFIPLPVFGATTYLYILHTTIPSNNITLNILSVATLNNSQKQQKHKQQNTLATSTEITYEKPKEQKTKPR